VRRSQAIAEALARIFVYARRGRDFDAIKKAN